MDYELITRIICEIEVHINKSATLVPIKGAKDHQGNDIHAFREKGESKSQLVVMKKDSAISKEDIYNFIRENCPVGNRLELRVEIKNGQYFRNKFVQITCSWHTQEIIESYLKWLPALEEYLK